MSEDKNCEIVRAQNFDFFIANGEKITLKRPGFYADITFNEPVDDDLLTKGQMKITPDGLITFESEKSIEAFVHLSSRELVQQNKNQLMGLCSRYGANYLRFEAIPRCPGRVFLQYWIVSDFPKAQLLAPSENAEGAGEDGRSDEASVPALVDAPANIFVTQERSSTTLTEEDREIMQSMLERNAAQREIAKVLKINQSSVSRERGRNCSPGEAYSASAAQKKSDERVAKRTGPELLDYPDSEKAVRDCLRAGIPVMQIPKDLQGYEGVSYARVRRLISFDKANGGDLHTYVGKSGRPPKRRG